MPDYRMQVVMLASGMMAFATPAPAQVPAPCGDEVAQAATRSQFEYESDGHVVRGLIYRPARPNGAGVILLHGARGLQSDAPRFDPHAIALASRGYYVLMPNYYDAQPPAERRTSRDLRVWRNAVRDGVRFLETQPDLETGKVGLWGYSLGGFLAGEAAMEIEGIAGAVSVAGGLDAGEAGRGQRSVPLLLLHARRDDVISLPSTRDWASSLRRRGAAVEIEPLDVEGHGLSPSAWCDVFSRTLAFLDANARGAEASR